MSDDQFYMKKALLVAQKGAGRVSPNPLVGCVIVKEGKIVGQGYHETYGAAHAEVNALRAAGKKAAQATLYVTLEPCHHHGKTPPCVDKVIKAGVSRAVIAMTDPDTRTNGKSIAKLKKAGIEVVTGVCEQEAGYLVRFFVKAVKKQMPYVICKVAQTRDGMITLRKGTRTQITGRKEQQYVQQMRKAVDAVLVGVGTVEIDDPRLNVRDQKCPQPKRVILDAALKTKPDARLLHTPGGQVILVCGLPENHPRVQLFQNKGVVVLCGFKVKAGKLELKSVLKRLFEQGICSILVEGGARVLEAFLKAGLVDEFQIIVSPKVAGQRGLAWCGLGDMKNWKLLGMQRLGQDVLTVFLAKS